MHVKQCFGIVTLKQAFAGITLMKRRKDFAGNNQALCGTRSNITRLQYNQKLLQHSQKIISIDLHILKHMSTSFKYQDFKPCKHQHNKRHVPITCQC